MLIKNEIRQVLSLILPVLLTASTVSYLATLMHHLPTTPLMIASIGASITIVFVVPSSPMGRTWPVLAGHLLPALVGVCLTSLIDDATILCLTTITLSIITMVIFKCVHPPGVATALVPAISQSTQPAMGLSFLLDPVLFNIIPLIICGYFYRWYLNRRASKKEPSDSTSTLAHNKSSIFFSELHETIATRNEWLDIDERTLDDIFKQTHLLALEHRHQKLTCEHVMTSRLITLKPNDTIHKALELLQQNQFTALPVVDDEHELVGIFSLVDFLRSVENRKFDSFIALYLQAKKKAKKEVSQFMNAAPVFMRTDTHIARTIPLLTSGYHHIPIVDNRNRLKGMVTQSDLIEFLYNIKA
ncbi:MULTISPECIES: HPP family protein [Vibrio]|uniref:HPP family protein n=1 Tax=Vibrio TaxID=662 RepID=UPI001B832CEF|nr:CBS domain-containing protein [Vibrio fluvialis]ELJ8672575.1 CBS domain-containing protein [Vibrio cholerae]HBC3408370.1 CBS domain-containing protein [Vibrio parahaemolyticus]ELJ8690536.1 CBS domain-containing protein [Vibrio cholerae]MBY7848524.1 CBS domain-containing protein [Vibrio fluvialis]MDE5176869.1 CBS domain-containing protein [Vibrio fluvialis]